jgi:LPS-assembly protein
MPSLCRRSIVASALVLLCATAQATDDACPPPRTPQKPAVRLAPDPRAPVEVRAREVRAERGGVAELSGDVELRRAGDRIDAEHLRYDQASADASADGPVRYRNIFGDMFETEQLRMDVRRRVGETGVSRYWLRDDFARGDAGRIEFLGPDATRLTNVRYTTCRPGQDDWFLNIGELELDNTSEIGTAWHTSVEFLGLPVFYFPYVNFSIADQRKSGFLFPRVGHSDNLGYEISAPYYFNLAPNYDATINPRVLTKRGLELQNEFRYLLRDGTGTLELDVLPNDRVTDDDRAAGVLRHQQTFNRFWSGSLDIRGVSDQAYFDDFGDRLNITAQSYLPRTAELGFRGSSWLFTGRLADHQTIDKTVAAADEPYARLPQLQLLSAAQPLPNRLYPQFEAEWNRFDHAVRLTGERLNLASGVSLRAQNDWGYVTPRLGARYIGYRLDRDDDSTPGLARAVLSLDSGVVLERDTQWGENPTLQTLEPRLFYLRVPAKNQDDLPNFDTALPDLSFAALFRENRFNGGDRIGDANQLTAAITTRYLDTTQGVERLRLSLGRIYYFDDLEVNLPAGVQSPTFSDIVAEASAWLVGNWHLRETVQWNSHHRYAERNSFYLQYQPARNRIVTLGQVMIRDQLGQYDFALEWPVSARWAVRGRTLQSTRDDRNVESYLGVEYNACCWALRVTASRRWQDPEQVDAIGMELQLNGLSKFGKAPESPLRQGLFFKPEEPRRSPYFE